MNSHQKRQLYDHVATIGKSLSSPKRLEILELLAQGERSVEDLAGLTSLSIANTSRHLRVLRDARLCESRRQGLFVFYRLAGDDVVELTDAVRTLAERRIADVDQLLRHCFGARETLTPVSREELLARAREKKLIILDVRPRSEFMSGHIAGARSVPVDELCARIAELPDDAHYVAYCRGPYCVMAHDAVTLLRRSGRDATRLVDGFPQWRAAGLPVATGAEPQT